MADGGLRRAVIMYFLCAIASQRERPQEEATENPEAKRKSRGNLRNV